MPNIIDEILLRPKPLDIASWWKKQPPNNFADSLDVEETAYLEYFTSTEVDPVFRIGRGIANVGSLTVEEKERAKKYFGETPDSLFKFVQYENRRRIVAHYVLLHPATIAYELQLYRITRDVVPPLFIGERVYELFTGEEAFTGEKVSRLHAAVDILIVIVLGRVLRAARPSVSVRPPVRSLTDPIYDMPPEGGGMNINGRWYTEHALERMAPDTPQIRAELRTRAINRLNRLGIKEGSGAWDQCLEKALSKSKIDPRGVPPSVVEAEITKPGSTNVKVITAKRGQIVVTVIPKKLK